MGQRPIQSIRVTRVTTILSRVSHLGAPLVVGVFARGITFVRDTTLAADTVTTGSARAGDMLLLSAALGLTTGVGINYGLSRATSIRSWVRRVPVAVVLVLALSVLAVAGWLVSPIAGAAALLPLGFVGALSSAQLIRSGRYLLVQAISLVHLLSAVAIYHSGASSTLAVWLFVLCFATEAVTLMASELALPGAIRSSSSNGTRNAALFAVGLTVMPLVDLAILRQAGLNELALFQAGARVPMTVSTLLVGGLVLQFMPAVRQAAPRFHDWYAGRMRFVVGICIALSVGLLTIGWPILERISGQRLEGAFSLQSQQVFIVTAGGLPIAGALLLSTRVLMELGHSDFVLVNLLVSIMLNLVLDLVLVGSFGALGIAISSQVVIALSCVVAHVQMRKLGGSGQRRAASGLRNTNRVAPQ